MGHAMKPAPPDRRGVLLVVVLSMLTLFMMLGVTYLVVSTRARKTARAFADNVVSVTSLGVNTQRLLDEAMMAIARGTTVTSATTPLRTGDDLLGDKYGNNAPETGTIAGNATGSAIIAMPTTGLSNTHLLAGRVITFTMPTLNDVSTRVLRADASGTLYIPGGQTVAGVPITATGINAAKLLATSTRHFLVNGREFAGGSGDTNEPYDAYPTTSGTSDPHLARVALVSGTTVVTPSFGVNATTATIDNDSDGTPDSGWIDVGFPVITDLAGNTMKPKVAVLVIDLDGRLNLNVHGARTDLENTAGTTDCTNKGFGTPGVSSTNFYPDIVFTTTSSTVTLPMQTLPRGMGGGVAEISLFGPVVGNASSTGLAEMLAGTSLITSRPQLADNITSRPRPNLGDTQGRYGESIFDPGTPTPLSSAKPGEPDVDDNAATDRWVSASGTTYFGNTQTRYGSPSDLKGRMRIWTDAFGQPVYYKPHWSRSGAGNRGLLADDDVVDDPYEINAGRAGPRLGAVRGGSSAPPDNLYTTADLEGVLRFFDPDSMRLPRRLLTICRDWASAARPLITTESWDTPAVTGTAWENVIASPFSGLLSGANAADFFSPETIMGHKMDLNRPFHDSDVTEKNDTTGVLCRQQFARHLYCLLVALFHKNSGAAPTPAEAEQLAQWAVNVVDFRDADSIMTPFDYDETFTAGSTSWNATKRVWGAERPEILITETLAWHDRKTDDTDVGKKVTEDDQTQADNDFDQNQRPRGAFFVELYSPWGSQAMQYSGTAVPVTDTGSSLPLRGEPLPAEFVSGSSATTRFEVNATLSLSRTHSGTGNTSLSGTGSPVWRLVTVRGNVKNGNAFGAEPLLTGSSGTSGWIVDPSRQGSTATIDRVFYFTVPPQAQRDEKQGAVFWQSQQSQADSAAANPSQKRYVVVGTDHLGYRRSDPVIALSGTNNRVDHYFDKPHGKPASISEPIVLDDDDDADGYDALLPNGLKFTPDVNAQPHVYDRQLGAANAIDQPLDANTSHPANVSPPFLDASGQPALMQNGTHENFAVVHLQRLADPTKQWNTTTNPYVTVDSMPVDLTVVNSYTGPDDPMGTNARKNENYDEPNLSAKDYRPASTERGGKRTDNNAAESDIWNRRVTASVDWLGSANAFRTATVGPRTAKDLLPPVGPGKPYRLQPSPVGSGTMTLVVSGTNNHAAARPDRFNDSRFPWLVWTNRPYTSAAELALVPTPSAFRLPTRHTTGTGSGWSAQTRPFSHLCGLFESGTTTAQPWRHVVGLSGSSSQASILDFLHVPSRFVGCYLTVSASTTNAATLGLDKFPVSQISHFREPGRININTLAMSSMAGTSVSTGTSWNPLFGKVTIATGSSASTPPFFGVTATGSSSVSGTTFTLRPPFSPPAWNEESPPNPFLTGTTGPASSLLTVLDRISKESFDHTGSWPAAARSLRDHDMDAYFRYGMPMRMTNMVTTRSNVYAVWITVGYFQYDPSTNDYTIEIPPVRRNRAFYIFDRSIPVGYERGKDHNVRDAILLRRIIQ